MAKDILLLGIGALFGLGVALVSLAIPVYLPNLPIWVPFWMFWGGLGLMAIMVFDAVLLYLWWDEQQRPKVGPALFINLGMCLVALGFVWHYSPPVSLKSGDNHSTGNLLDQTIQLECSWAQIPDTIPANGYYEIEIIEPPMHGGVVSSSLQPGSKNNASSSAAPNYTYRCRFSNFGAAPVLNVEAELSVDLREVVWNEHGSSSGKVLSSAKLATPRANLGHTERSSFDFYIRNYTDKWADVTLPKTAHVQAVGNNTVQMVRLIPPQLSGFGLVPFVRVQPTNLLSLFMADLKPKFGVTWNASADLKVDGGKSLFRIYYNIQDDLEANSKFIMFYVPYSAYAYDTISFLSQNYTGYFSDIESNHWAVGGTPGLSDPVNTKDLKFSGRVYVYLENPFGLEKLGELTKAFRTHGAQIEFRGLDYLAATNSTLATAARQVPPRYEIHDGIPKQVP